MKKTQLPDCVKYKVRGHSLFMTWGGTEKLTRMAGQNLVTPLKQSYYFRIVEGLLLDWKDIKFRKEVIYRFTNFPKFPHCMHILLSDLHLDWKWQCKQT